MLTNYTNSQFNRAYNGLEVSARKRMAHHWLMNTSLAYSSTNVNIGGSDFAGTPSLVQFAVGRPDQPHGPKRFSV